MSVIIDVRPAVNGDGWYWTATAAHGWDYSTMIYPSHDAALYAGLVVKSLEFGCLLTPDEDLFAGDYELTLPMIGPMWR